jgi:hypothetical protein
MDKYARQVIGAFCIFLMLTFSLCWFSFDPFCECVLRGSILVAVVGPFIHQNYNDSDRYRFQLR